jgi:hypothetical protein
VGLQQGPIYGRQHAAVMHLETLSKVRRVCRLDNLRATVRPGASPTGPVGGSTYIWKDQHSWGRTFEVKA